MTIEHYQDYFWKMGKPYGQHPTDQRASVSYKIITDPYHKRYSIEKYQQGLFKKIIYDSILLDFRHLNPIDQVAWQKELMKEEEQFAMYLLRNQDDRAILIERQSFEKNWCRSCFIYSAQGILISKHRMYYQAFGDAFNGVILFDSEDHPVMTKTYQIDLETGEFTTLLSEEWNMPNPPLS